VDACRNSQRLARRFFGQPESFIRALGLKIDILVDFAGQNLRFAGELHDAPPRPPA
jgi:hypothetical protein